MWNGYSYQRSQIRSVRAVRDETWRHRVTCSFYALRAKNVQTPIPQPLFKQFIDRQAVMAVQVVYILAEF